MGRLFDQLEKSCEESRFFGLLFYKHILIKVDKIRVWIALLISFKCLGVFNASTWWWDANVSRMDATLLGT